MNPSDQSSLRQLVIDPAMGMAGDMFSAALIALGAPADLITGAMARTAQMLGDAQVLVKVIPTPEGPGHQLQVDMSANHDHLHEGRARELLEAAIATEDLGKPYADFARRALDILIAAEREAHAHHPALRGMAHHHHHHEHHTHAHAHHHEDEAVLHEAQDILLDVIGAAVGLQFLAVDLQSVRCFMPVAVGGGIIRFSHGEMTAPAPATEAMLKHHRIPHVSGPVDVELLTPTGAALLAALHPIWSCREPLPDHQVLVRGLGLGTKTLRPLNALRLALLQP